MLLLAFQEKIIQEKVSLTGKSINGTVINIYPLPQVMCYRVFQNNPILHNYNNGIPFLCNRVNGISVIVSQFILIK